MNKVICSICLNPTNLYSDYFKDIIVSLADKYNTYPFQPHLTIYGVLRASQKEIEEAIKYALSDIKTFSLKTVKLDHSDKLTKTLFIQFSMSNTLLNIHKRLSQKLKKYLINYKEYDLNPHISLIYKHGLSTTEKEKIIKKIKLKNEFIFDSCSIITLAKPFETEDAIKGLKEVYRKSF